MVGSYLIIQANHGGEWRPVEVFRITLDPGRPVFTHLTTCSTWEAAHQLVSTLAAK